jgi:hypothetical protein
VERDDRNVEGDAAGVFGSRELTVASILSVRKPVKKRGPKARRNPGTPEEASNHRRPRDKIREVLRDSAGPRDGELSFGYWLQ